MSINTGLNIRNAYFDQQKQVQLVTPKFRNPYVSHSLKIATVDIWIRYIEVYSYIHTLHSFGTACLVERKSQY